MTADNGWAAGGEASLMPLGDAPLARSRAAIDTASGTTAMQLLQLTAACPSARSAVRIWPNSDPHGPLSGEVWPLVAAGDRWPASDCDRSAT